MGVGLVLKLLVLAIETVHFSPEGTVHEVEVWLMHHDIPEWPNYSEMDKKNITKINVLHVHSQWNGKFVFRTKGTNDIDVSVSSC